MKDFIVWVCFTVIAALLCLGSYYIGRADGLLWAQEHRICAEVK